MDRFIVSVSTETAAEYFNLKSNMDRFIVSSLRQLCIDRDI